MKRFLPLLMLSLMLAACNPSQTAVDDLQKLTERIEQKSDNWSEADWDDAVMNYSEICQTIDRYDYTDAELRQIGELKGRCLAKFYRHAIHETTDELQDAVFESTQELHDAFIELGGAVEGLLNGLK